MEKYQVLDDVGLTYKKTEIEQCLKLRFKNTKSNCILSVDYLYYIISTKLQVIVYQIHIIHSKQYLLLNDLLNLLSNLEIYFNLYTKRLLNEETKVRDKLDDLSTKKLRTKNTVKTSEQLNLPNDLQKVVHNDLEGLREMREATHSTLNSIITDRVNTSLQIESIRFFAKKIQKIFPSEISCSNNGNYQQFIYNNIQYTSELALMMQDCHKFLFENSDLKQLIDKSGLDKKYRDDDDDMVSNLNQQFEQLNNKMSDSIHEMNKNCSTLQELFQLKSKLAKRLIQFVKYHWK